MVEMVDKSKNNQSSEMFPIVRRDRYSMMQTGRKPRNTQLSNENKDIWFRRTAFPSYLAYSNKSSWTIDTFCV